MRKTFFMSANNTTKEKWKKEEKETLKKQLTLNSPASPFGKRYDYLLLCCVFQLVLWEELLFSLFSLVVVQGRRSLTQTHVNIQIFLSFNSQRWYTTNIYRRTTTRQKDPPARAPLTARYLTFKREKEEEHNKIGSKREEPPLKDRERERERERKKKNLIFLFKTLLTKYEVIPWRKRSFFENFW